MSAQLISLSTDLARLRDDGFEVDVRHNHLVVMTPYVAADRTVKRGALVSELTLAGDVTTRPGTHVVMFTGEAPHDAQGRPLPIEAGAQVQKIGEGLIVTRQFSRKPAAGYADYYEKMSTYADMLSAQAEAIDPSATARTWRVVESTDADAVFNYVDNASCRAGIWALTRKFSGLRIAIIGAGSTGSYVLDQVAKTPVAEIHLFDGDKFLQHNAFRAPGAAALDELRRIPSKVAYLAGIYGRMHRGIVVHEHHIDASNLTLLDGFDYIFVCIDRGEHKPAIIAHLEARGTSFIDVGMGIEEVDERLIATVRVTCSTAAKRDHVHEKKRIPLGGRDNDAYDRNIQIADLNMLNAAFAVIKWKKLVEFYQDLEHEHFSSYTLDGNHLVNEDAA